MGLVFNYLPGQTPLDEDEKNGLKIQTILVQSELDEFEQKNIEQAILWTLTKKLSSVQLLTESFVKKLHKLMFGEVWDWAGSFRRTNKNIGVDKWNIPTELQKMFDDVLFWVEQESFEADEIVIRFKHRLVCIHCFPNGNGRHSRLMADVLVQNLFGREVFSWGRRTASSDVRSKYINSLRQADCNDFKSLIEFARS